MTQEEFKKLKLKLRDLEFIEKRIGDFEKMIRCIECHPYSVNLKADPEGHTTLSIPDEIAPKINEILKEYVNKLKEEFDKA